VTFICVDVCACLSFTHLALGVPWLASNAALLTLFNLLQTMRVRRRRRTMMRMSRQLLPLQLQPSGSSWAAGTAAQPTTHMVLRHLPGAIQN
jgi:hypothetical protein